MSDTYDFSNTDFTDLSGLSDVGSTVGAGIIPGLSSLFSSSSSSTPLVAQPLNLALPTSTGVSGMLGDISKLITGVYQGEAQIEQLQLQNQIAKAKAANQLETVKTTPNIWLVLGLGAVGLFALEIMDKRK